MGRTKLILSFVLSATIGGVLLYLAAGGLDWDELKRYFANADHGRLAMACGLYMILFAVVHALRTWRWVYLVRPLGEVSSMAVMRAGLIGFTAIILLPLRLGELVRPYVLSRESEASMPAALGTVVVERVVDGLFITFLLFLTLLTYGGEGSVAFAYSAGVVSLVIFTGAACVCVGALLKRALTLRIVRFCAGLVSVRLADKLASTLETFIDGVGALRAEGALLPFLGFTVAYWTVNGLSIALFAQIGFDIPLGPWEGMTVLALLVVGLMVPAGPGLAGNYELFALEALALFVVPEEVAVAGAALVASMHLCQFAVQAIPGLVLMWLPIKGASGYRLFALSDAARRASGEVDGTNAQSSGK